MFTWIAWFEVFAAIVLNNCPEIDRTDISTFSLAGRLLVNTVNRLLAGLGPTVILRAAEWFGASNRAEAELLAMVAGAKTVTVTGVEIATSPLLLYTLAVIVY